MRYALLFFFATFLLSASTVYGQGYQFVPLTNLPGIDQVSQADTFPNFFNILYRLCIGAAAVVAILQIMRAGMYFMFNKGSVAHNEQAKHLISSSVLGLVLVLSPAIIFGIINPDILKLKLDVSGIQTGDINNGIFTGRDVLLWQFSGDQAQAIAQCKRDGGRIRFLCMKGEQIVREVGQGQSCAPETLMNSCSAQSEAPNTAEQCTLKYDRISSVNTGSFCPSGTSAIPSGCCSDDRNYTNRCCGVSKGGSAPVTQQPAPSTPAPSSPAPANPQPSGNAAGLAHFTDFSIQGTNRDGSQCVTVSIQTHDSLAACQRTLRSTPLNSGMSVRHNCITGSTQTYYAPNKSTYDRISALPACR